MSTILFLAFSLHFNEYFDMTKYYISEDGIAGGKKNSKLSRF